MDEKVYDSIYTIYESDDEDKVVLAFNPKFNHSERWEYCVYCRFNGFDGDNIRDYEFENTLVGKSLEENEQVIMDYLGL